MQLVSKNSHSPARWNYCWKVCMTRQEPLLEYDNLPSGTLYSHNHFRHRSFHRRWRGIQPPIIRPFLAQLGATDEIQEELIFKNPEKPLHAYALNTSLLTSHSLKASSCSNRLETVKGRIFPGHPASHHGRKMLHMHKPKALLSSLEVG